jgi:uncharacterized membrane protein
MGQGHGVAANISRVAALVERAERRVGKHQRLIERITFAVGRPLTLYVIASFSALWVAFNCLAPGLGLRRFDPPPFAWLQGLLSLSALLMTTMILTTQNRLGADAQQRDQLDLHVNLLAEQKATKIISLLEELRTDLPTVKNRPDPVADAMTTSVDPESVATALEGTLEKNRK